MILPDAAACVQPSDPPPALPQRLSLSRPLVSRDVQPVAAWAPEVKSAHRAGATSLRAGGAVDPVARARCRVVAELVDDLLHLAGKRPALPRNRRCVATHARQIAIYLSHVVLQVSLTDLGIVFGRDRTTASYSCHVVEDLRDDPEFDAFVSVIERVIVSALRIGQDQADA